MVRTTRRDEPDDVYGRDDDEPEGQPRSAGGVAEFILSGLALILPALAFTIAALIFYPPAARAMAPVALGLTFAGLGLVLIGWLAGRRL